MEHLQKYTFCHHGSDNCFVPDHMVSGVDACSSRDSELCMLHDSSSGSKEKADARNDDDTQDDLLYLDDCAFPVIIDHAVRECINKNK